MSKAIRVATVEEFEQRSLRIPPVSFLSKLMS